MTHKLTHDVFDNFRKGKDLPLIAKKGQEVLLITLHDHVAICEAGNGERFSVNVKVLDAIKIKK